MWESAVQVIVIVCCCTRLEARDGPGCCLHSTGTYIRLTVEGGSVTRLH